jgi:DNA-binding NtrC family response regulator
MKPLAILIADDDELVRLILARVARELTNEVVEVDTGAAAIAALEARSFDVVITDHRMPGASGIDVVEACAVLRPACRCILVSGYADEGVASAVEKWGGRVLHKPFGAATLRDVLARLLE